MVLMWVLFSRTIHFQSKFLRMVPVLVRRKGLITFNFLCTDLFQNYNYLKDYQEKFIQMFTPQRQKLSPQPYRLNIDSFHKSQKYHAYISDKEKIGSRSTYRSENQSEPCYQMVDPKWKPFSQELEINKLSKWNSFCPFCGKFVAKVANSFIWTYSRTKVSYFCHPSCKDDLTTFTIFKTQNSFIDQRIIKPEIPMSLGSQQFHITISIEHSLSRIKYFYEQKKVSMNSGCLYIQYEQNKEDQLFGPNLILLPISQFKFALQLKSLKNPEGKKEEINFNVDLNSTQTTFAVIQASNSTIVVQGEFQKIQGENQKSQLAEKSNFKFLQTGQGECLIKFNKCMISFEKERLAFQQELQRKSSIEEAINEKQKINEEALEYFLHITTHAGSKQFQKKVKIMSGQEINQTIEKILPYLQQVIQNQYANYMFQSLIRVCNLQQKLKILQKIGEKISQIVCQQQGTFVFQQFISCLTNQEEYYFICQEIDENFYQLCLDNYGSHFVRKLIQNMPQNLLPFFSAKIIEFLVEFSFNKNAICVLKSILKALKNHNSQEKNAEFLKKIILCISMNTEEIINNEYGNYLIQEAYELFGSSFLKGINETIIRLFPSLGCEKYSASVIQNCIKKYWLYDQCIYQDLKASLHQKKILALYRNPYGNRVLLQIMELCDYLPLKQKVSSVISHDKSSKFNNNRWIHLRGNRWTGAVGTHYSSFTEAVNNKKNYNNII